MVKVLPKRHGRTVVEIHDEWVVKRFTGRRAKDRERFFYMLLPDCCPRLLDHDDMSLTIERLPVATELPEWKPVAQTRALIERIFAAGVHHRDVHAKNLVRGRDGSPLLIDWETACIQRADRSYDLVGPDASGVPTPVEHDGYQAQWWDSGATRFALGRWFA